MNKPLLYWGRGRIAWPRSYVKRRRDFLLRGRDGHVGAGLPDLRRRLAVPAEPEHVPGCSQLCQ